MDNNLSCHHLDLAAIAKGLDVDLLRGLTSAEAKRRQDQFGPNALKEKPRPSFWKRLLDQFNNFLILILLAAAAVSFGVGVSEYNRTGSYAEFVDAIAILAIVILNAVLGLVQEGKAEEALAALKKMAAPNAQVMRDGRQVTIPAPELVPGDIVILETGNHVPADVRLIETVNLKIEEASLTGESVAVEKNADAMVAENAGLGDRVNCGFMGTTITYGRGRAVVVATGMGTQIGKIAEMIQSVEEEPTPLQRKLDQLGRTLGIASLVICGIVGVVGIVRAPSFQVLTQQGLVPYLTNGGRETLLEMFMVAVSLAIAAVPEGLPAVVTICLALGMQEMVRRHALIRRMAAVETLGSATAICSDKTGTLTQNEMMVVRLATPDIGLQITGRGYSPEGEFRRLNGHDDRYQEVIDPKGVPPLELLLRAGLLCNDAKLEPDESTEGGWRITGDPTEAALVVMAAKAGMTAEALNAAYPRINEVPFDSERKRMSTIHAEDGKYVAYTKGAPDLMLALCEQVLVEGRIEPLTDAMRQRILAKNEEMAGAALRVLGIAYRPLAHIPEDVHANTIEHTMTFLGLVGMIDPPRPEVKAAVAVAKRAGLRTVMVTGDYQLTGAAIARELDIMGPADRAIAGAELEQMSDGDLDAAVGRASVFARVSPQHKVRIVSALRRQGQVVAMTGDGVNDAPALKRADIGVAMGITGTDVSKETADMVLTDDNYASIVSAVEQGRIIFSNIRKFVYYLISCNMGEIMILFVAMIAGLPLPLTALQLLVLNLVTDGAPALALGMEKGEPGIMDRPPRPVQEPIINRSMILGTAIQTVAIAGATLGAFLLGLAQYGREGDGLAVAETMAFLTLSLSELLRAYTARSEHVPVLRMGLFSNRYMQYAVLASAAIILAILYLPFLNTIFGVRPLAASAWLEIIPFILLPAVVAEAQKVVRLRLEKRA